MCFNQKDADKSIRGFEKFVKPVLQSAFGAKKILPTERHNNELATALDQNAGIDGFVVDADGWTFGYSSRVQFGTNYASFSIRRSRTNGATTEYDKLNNPRQIKPSYHVQTFVKSDEDSAAVAIVETVDLLRYIYKHPDQWRKTKDGETFFYIPWRELKDARIYSVKADGQIADLGNCLFEAANNDDPNWTPF